VDIFLDLILKISDIIVAEANMKKKIGTVMEERLLWEAKKAALEKKEQLSRIFEEAVTEYLEKRKKEKAKKGIVRKTKGLIKLSPERLKKVMSEAGIYEA
jgi:hypothetical protein